MLRRVLPAAVLALAAFTFARAQDAVPPTPPEPPAQPDAETQAKIDALIGKLGSDDWDERAEAERGLEEMGKVTVESLRKAMETASDPEVKVRAKRLLQKLGGIEVATELDDAAFDELLETLRTRDGVDWWERSSKPSFFLSDLYTREDYKAALKDPKFAPRLAKALEEETGALRRNVCYLLADLANPEVAPQVAKLLEDADGKTRALAVYCCGKLGNVAVTAQIVKALVDQDKLCRVAAAVALENLPAAEAIDPLLVALNDDDPRIRFNAYYSLRSLTGQNFSFNAWGPAPARTATVKLYEEWWTQNKANFKPLPPRKRKKETEEPMRIR